MGRVHRGRASRTKSVLLIAALVIMWGVSWPIYKIALNDTPPILFAGLRTLIGGILLGIVRLPKYREIRWKQTWHIYLIAAFFNAIVFYGLQTVGLRYLPEGLFTVVVYLQPVLIGLLTWLWLGERLSVLKLVGLLLGFVGVGVISVSSISGHVSPIGIILAIATAVGWAIGTIYVKKIGNRVDALWLVAFQCGIGGLVMTAVGSGFEHWSSIVWNAPYLCGLIYGAVFGIPISWVVFFTLVRSGDASKVASFTFLVPLIAIFLGTLFLHEPFTDYLLIGLVLIVVSIYLVNRTPRARG
ncbi:DMT family transporter [Alicyclobacillus acidoterrestris]|uniref:DMT family transporter n=1 Tax=Alicyclobacillus acidoterrestris (strain ATCC 49025 / DSM 3922 / CIP 106132 / NCIMB 13137 / GD3B) TaxID=1356854 RepID=A0A9E7CT76_ALIAG|nr:DMT family transporter [Alicyclobacillus acidoterrestris]UNO50950.1 DMT family transporter [Alicyclobacillus acidoterrestris]